MLVNKDKQELSALGFERQEINALLSNCARTRHPYV